LDDRIYKKEALTLVRNGYIVVHIGYGEDFKDFYTDDAIRLIQIKKTKWEQFCFGALFRAAKSVSADVYHLHDVELCRIASKLQGLFWRPKVIYDAHEPYDVFLRESWYKRPFMRFLLSDFPAVVAENCILRHVDYLIATETNVANRFRMKNPHTAIIYNYSCFYPKDIVTEADAKEFDIVYCGSISQGTGIFLMLKALVAAKKRGYNLKAAFIGAFASPAIQFQAERIIQKEKLTDNLIFTGEIPLEKVSWYYEKSKTAFCLFASNRTNQSILPIKLFEYAAFGLPVVGSDFGHIEEIIRDNDIGVCVNPHCADDVASALIRLITDDTYKQYFFRCIHCVKTKYLWESQQASLLRIYEELFNLQ
jgi:glycosyltransferase involved in cell wall biosynthesis